jgi:hypothetical protein
MLFLALFLPIMYFNDGNYVYSYGPATNLLLVIGGIVLVMALALYLPLFQSYMQ